MKWLCNGTNEKNYVSFLMCHSGSRIRSVERERLCRTRTGKVGIENKESASECATEMVVHWAQAEKEQGRTRKTGRQGGERIREVRRGSREGSKSRLVGARRRARVCWVGKLPCDEKVQHVSKKGTMSPKSTWLMNPFISFQEHP